eukprot:c3166_g1_i1.p1 GENE.c3166_g1_i1~~c3166_g1_i1.p1  ORF type:complete len:271 (+),score=43.93 c3166_g1_i1:2-814(+)
MAFFLREVSEAVYPFKFLIKFKVPFYSLVAFLVFLDLLGSFLTGLYIKFGSISFWTVKAVFFVVVDIVLGFWYLYERQVFIKAQRTHQSIKRANTSKKKSYFPIAMLYSSLSMIFLGVSLIFIGIPSIFGTCYGYFFTWAVVATFLQISSTAQVLLFGNEIGAMIKFIQLKLKFIKLKFIGSTTSKQNENDTNKNRSSGRLRDAFMQSLKSKSNDMDNSTNNMNDSYKNKKNITTQNTQNDVLINLGESSNFVSETNTQSKFEKADSTIN